MSKFSVKKIISIVVVCCFLVSLCACGGSNSIVGTWEITEDLLGVDVTTSYTFNADGTGSMNLLGELELDFTYEFPEDGKVQLNTEFLGVTDSMVYGYSIENDTLTLDDGEDWIALQRTK